MKYSGRWTAGLNKEEKALMEELLGVNNKVLDRLAQICYNMSIESEKASNDYDSPNWALRQADLVGRRKVLDQIVQLCTPTKERTMTNGR